MDTRAVANQVILDGDFDQIAPTSLDPRTRIGLIEDFAVGIDNTISME